MSCGLCHSTLIGEDNSVTILRVGATKKYTENWQQVFGGKKAKATAAAPDKKSTSKKKAAPKSTKAKGAAKKSAKA